MAELSAPSLWRPYLLPISLVRQMVPGKPGLENAPE
jgi:hypothetical protein